MYMDAKQLLAMHASTKNVNLPAHTVHAGIGNSQRLNSHMERHAMNNVGTCTSTLWKEKSLLCSGSSSYKGPHVLLIWIRSRVPPTHVQQMGFYSADQTFCRPTLCEIVNPRPERRICLITQAVTGQSPGDFIGHLALQDWPTKLLMLGSRTPPN